MAESLRDILARLDRALRPGLGSQAAPGSGRPDETPLRRGSILEPEGPIVGTPPSDSGDVQAGFKIIGPGDVVVQKYAARYRRKLNLSSASPLDGYVSDLVPVIMVGPFEPEDYFPDDILAGIATTIGQNGAGTRSNIVLRNPANSRVKATVTFIQAARINTAGRIILATCANAADVNAFTVTPRDTRAGLAVAGTGANTIHGDFNNVGAGPGGLSAFGSLSSGANQGNFPWTDPVVLTPGFDLVVEPDIDNEGIFAAISFRISPLNN